MKIKGFLKKAAVGAALMIAYAQGALAFGDLVVAGGTKGTDYTYTGNVLTVLTQTPMTVSMSPDSMYEYTQEMIAVNPGEGKTANLTIDDLYLYVTSSGDYSPLDVVSGTLNLTLEGENKIVFSGDNLAAVHVPYGTTLNVGGTGSLYAETDYHGAAIGGNGRYTGQVEEYGSIVFNSGNVTAQCPRGVYTAAAIGGGTSGAATSNGYGSVTVNGGTVTALGTVGGGYNCKGGTVNVTGGKLTASYVGSGLADYPERMSGGTMTVSGRGTQAIIGGSNASVTVNSGTLKSTARLKGRLTVNGGQAEVSGGVGSLNVTDGNVKIDNTSYGSYPGVGGVGSNENEVNMTIAGGTVRIKANEAAIGCGTNAESNATGTVTITGGTLLAESMYGFGIGSSSQYSSHSVQVLLQPAQGQTIKAECGADASSLEELGVYAQETTLTSAELTKARKAWRFTAGGETAHAHAACGRRMDACAHDDHDAVTYTAWDGSQSKKLTGGPHGEQVYSYVLSKDVNQYIIVGENAVLNLCLNGHRMENSSFGAPIQLEGGKINLCDCVGGGSISSISVVKKNESSAVANLYEISVTDSGSGVGVTNSTFNMYGGEISGHEGQGDGIGLSVYHSQVLLDGVTIKNNVNDSWDSFSAAIRQDGGKMTIRDSSITGNKSGRRGAVSLYGGEMTIINTKIQNNETNLDDGYLLYGGGIFVNSGTLTMEGGAIKNNTSVREGAGIVMETANANVNLKDVEISGNTAATTGGGIYLLNGVLSVSGNTEVMSNKANGAASNLLLGKDKTFISTGLKSGSFIYVKTEELPTVGNPVVYMKPGSGYTLGASDLRAAFHQENIAARINEDGNAEFYIPTYALTIEDGYGTVSNAQPAAGEQVTITALEREGYTFTEWESDNYYISNTDKTKTSLTFSMPARDLTFKANYKTISYSISYDLGGGSLPAGKSNPRSYTVEKDTFTLNNPVKEGFEFLGWTGSCGSDPVQTVTIEKGTTGALRYTAVFSEAKYTLSAAAGENGSVDIQRENVGLGNPCTLEVGAQATFVAVPSEGFGFAGWYDDDDNLVSDQQNYTIEVNADVSLTARFDREYPVVLHAVPLMGGTTSGGSHVLNGKEWTIAANPNEGWVFTGWYSGDQKVSDEAEYTFTVQEEMELDARFERAKYTVSVTVEPEGAGTIVGAGEYESDSDITVKAIGNGRYRFAGWYIGDECVEEWLAYQITVNDNISLTAKFVEANLLTVQGGIFSGEELTQGALNEGEETEIMSVLPNENAAFSRWEVVSGDAKIAVNTDSETMLTMGAQDTVVKAHYAYILNVVPAGSGAASQQRKEEGAIVQLPAPGASDGYNSFWQISGVQLPEGTDLSGAIEFVMPGGPVTATVVSSRNTYTIRYDLDGGSLPQGSVNPETYTVESEAITLVNPVREGWVFTGWTGTGLGEPTISVTIAAGSVGDRTYKANWRAEEIPVITVQPVDQTVGRGEQATFVVEAQCTGEMTYCWQVDRGDGNGFVDLGCSEPAYMTALVTSENDGYVYRCIVTARDGSVTSAQAVLHVKAAAADLPATGDKSMLMLWCILAAVCGFAAVILDRRRRA